MDRQPLQWVICTELIEELVGNRGKQFSYSNYVDLYKLHGINSLYF
jgi:hypothetical protein